ncbi:FAD/NAD(P)-binding protein [Pseudomonas sp. PDM10]|uniref:FAD/NAD(P)-binding protein n=1 Tax=Pseudomonas sp. PDM10 TaxID=2769269 RepID=UPI00178083F0|nr:FAD/NAD(P)-binding protein [Pseudomonas sp. PDM10]MBD9599171.1 FAD/NAD(P)-binding protein [Pseudomonas sp. PDM10]
MTAFTSLERCIAIVGAGFSGTLTAINTLRANPGTGLRILLIEKTSQICRGLAYRYDDDNLLLNVPAGNMSAIADEPNDFVAFCEELDPAFNAKSFISRRLYGEYLEQKLKDAMDQYPGVISIVNAQVNAVHLSTDCKPYRLQLENAEDVMADKVVLALGHFAPKLPAGIPVAMSSQVVSALDFAAIDVLDRDAPVVVLGMGHTAIDAVFRLTSCNPGRKVYMISRRGLLPFGHRFNPQPPRTSGFPSWLASLPMTIRAYTRAARKEAKAREADGGNWRDMLNELRPHTATLWKNLSDTERGKFLQRVVPYWDIHRHRLAPASERRIKQLIESGQVVQLAGRVRGVEKFCSGLRINVALRGHQGVSSIEVGALINGTGPSYDIAAVDQPILNQLLHDGLIKQDRQKIGLEVDEHYQLITTGGDSLRGLHYIGPMLKAKYWEAIAVPELRIHAQQLGQGLASQPFTRICVVTQPASDR